MALLKFHDNVPVEVTFVSEEYRPDEDRVVYELVDGNTMRLSTDVAAKINMWEIQPYESFMICRRWNGDLKQPVRYDVWLTPESEKRRADTEEPGLLAELRQSVAIVAAAGLPVGTQEAADLVAARKIAALRAERDQEAAAAAGEPETPPPPAEPPQEPVPVAATGTGGPRLVMTAPPRRSRHAAAAIRAVSGRHALRHVLAFVNEELKAANQQWGAPEIQDLVVTFLINGGLKEGRIQPFADLVEEGSEDAPF